MNRSFTKDTGMKNKPRKRCSTSFIVRKQDKTALGFLGKLMRRSGVLPRGSQKSRQYCHFGRVWQFLIQFSDLTE